VHNKNWARTTMKRRKKVSLLSKIPREKEQPINCSAPSNYFCVPGQHTILWTAQPKKKRQQSLL